MSRPVCHPFPAVAARLAVLALATASLSACSGWSRLSQVGEAPPLTSIQNPTEAPGYRPVSLPMPTQQLDTDRQANSLWRPGARAFFKDQRAGQIGDVLTVTISISDKATLNNTTSRGRTTKENQALPHVFGFEKQLQKILPNAADPTTLVDIDNSNTNTGTGKITRDETVNLKVAAVVTQVLPNGNLVIAGHQEVRVNYEARDLQITGIIRREDIDSTNTISHEKIAEARIAYGGRGQITDVQQPRYGTQVLDIVSPF
ncbi:MAG: flagellar basal body L-ring protein FlgH [Gemmatimonas sp.]